MRPLWQGGISFGLIYIPVKLYSATKTTTLDLDMLSKKDLAPIRYARINTKTGEEVSWDNIVKGYQYKKGDYIILHDEDFAAVNVKKTKSIEILDFVAKTEIDPIYFEKPYYLEPDKNAQKTYALLCAALTKTDRVAVAKFVLRNKEHTAVLETSGNLLILNQMRFKEDIKPTTGLELPDEKINAQELELAIEIISKMTEHFNPEQFKDEYTDELKAIIEKKASAHPELSPSEDTPTATKITDLMSQLRKSLTSAPNLAKRNELN